VSRRVAWAALCVICTLFVDAVSQRQKLKKVEEELQRVARSGTRQGEVTEACMSSLMSCRDLADYLTTEGMRALPAKFSPEAKKILSKAGAWKVAQTKNRNKPITRVGGGK
jgi:hypothetical protein